MVLLMGTPGIAVLYIGPEFVALSMLVLFVVAISRLPRRTKLALVYFALANIALGIHLFHGVWSLFQSMGWSNPRFNMWRRHLAVGIASLIVVGNVSFPIAVLANIVKVK